MNVPVTTHPMYAAWTSAAQFLRDARYSTIEASQIMSILGEKPNQIALRHLDKEFRVRILSEVFRDAIQRDLQSNDGKS